MTLSWSIRRRLMYSGGTLLVALCVAVFIWLKFFNPPPTCFDNKQNGDETGIDCGGSCTLVCSSDVHQPVVLWTRVFPDGPHTYTAMAYVQNNNGETGAHNVHYSFQLLDANNKLVVEKDGVMDIPPVLTIPMLVPAVDVGNGTVVRALFAFNDTPVWERVPHGSVPAIRIVNQTLASDATRLDATITNDSLADQANVVVVAVLFDANGVAQTASRSVIPSLASRSSTNVVFTWPQGVPDVARAEISVLPSF